MNTPILCTYYLLTTLSGLGPVSLTLIHFVTSRLMDEIGRITLGSLMGCFHFGNAPFWLSRAIVIISFGCRRHSPEELVV